MAVAAQAAPPRRSGAPLLIVAGVEFLAFVLMLALMSWQLAMLGAVALFAAWAFGAYLVQSKLNAISQRSDFWGELARQVGRGVIPGSEWQLVDLPRTMAAFVWLPILAVVLGALAAWLVWSALGAWLILPLGLAAVVVARRRQGSPAPPEQRTQAEAAADRINAEPGRFLFMLQAGLARDLPTEEGIVYLPHEAVAVVAVEVGDKSVLVEIDVYAYVAEREYPELADKVVASPMLQGHTRRVLPAKPHQFRALIGLEPLPEGEHGAHVLNEVPRLKPGHLALGVTDSDGTEFAVEFANRGGMLYLGPTRKGKSVSMNLVGAEALMVTRDDGSFDYGDVIVASTKNRADFAALDGFAEVYGSKDQADFCNRIDDLVRRGKELAAELEDAGIAKLDDIPLADRPPKAFVMLDECRAWLVPPSGGPREQSPQYRLGANLHWLFSRAGFLGWTTVLAHQGGKFDSFGFMGGEIINNAGVRLCFGHVTAWMRTLLLEGTESESEGGAAHGIQGRGNAWLDGDSALTEFQGYYATTDTIRRSLLRSGRAQR